MALTRSVLSFGVDHSAHCQLQPPATTSVFSIWTRMTGAITMSFATLCKPPITILGQDWLLAVDHKQLKWPSSTPNFKVCFRRGASGPIGVCKKTVSLQAKEKKNTSFFSYYYLAFSQYPHISELFMEKRRKLRHRDSGQDLETASAGCRAAAPVHRSALVPTDSVPDPRNLDPISGFGKAFGPALCSCEQLLWIERRDFPAPWFSFHPSGAAGAEFRVSGTSKEEEWWDAGR